MRPTLAIARQALKSHFGYDDFRPGQVDVVASVLAGWDTLGVLPTGGGKSLCFQVPALVLPGVTAVISPLISLMKDQVDRLVSLGIPATYLNSTLDAGESARRLASVSRGIAKMVYVAPERFLSDDLLRALERGGVGLLAVDEAHCISEWGHEFRPSFRRIAESTARFGGLQVVALTATATPKVRRDIAQQLRMRDARVIVGGFDRPNLSYAVTRCRDDDAKRAALADALRAEPGLAVVYASTRADVMRVARHLVRARVPAAAYHGGLASEARQEAQNAFMTERVRAIVATNAFGMGIDKPNVRLVLHFAMPGTLEAYYQEAGRAGRDGLPGRCVLLHAPGDRDTHDWFIRSTFPDPLVLRRVHSVLNELAQRARVPIDSAVVARRSGLLPADVQVAMRWLEQHGALARGAPDDGGPAAHVRLMALPRRIIAELDERGSERRLLRQLWRSQGGRLMDGIELTLPQVQDLGRNAERVLAALRERQFVQYESARDGLFLRRPGASLEQLGIDEAHLAERRAMEVGKLECMLEYAGTSACRRRVVLAYFGERRAADRCGGCDNCLRP